ncbi:MAG: hypothetical protein ACI4PM_05100 [Butyricicoccus sp.]
MNYQKMYAILCGAMSDAIDLLEPLAGTQQAIALMQGALEQAEELYLSAVEDT